ncbi:MAG: ATP-binding cassette domain-containing protein [Acidimicrobiia bacterium]
MPVLVADGLTKEYGDVVALADFKLSVDPGELVALVGHNGSGKSTFLRLVAGLLEPTDGVLVVANSPAGSLKARSEVSFVPDQPVLYDDLSVNEHIEFTARLHGELEWPERADALLDLLGLASRADDLPSRFSRGLRQKTSLVLGLVRPFSILLVDEPFVGLDPSGQSALTELLVEAASAGAAVLVATHQLSFLEHATRCVALRDGQTEFSGKVDVARIQSLLG